MNQAFANWVCRPQDEIYGKSPLEVLASDVSSFLRPILKRAQAGEHVEYERIGKNADGERRWMHGRVAPDLDSTRQGARPLLHRVRHPRPQARPSRRSPRARSSCAFSPTTSRSPSSTSTASRRYAFVNESFLQLNGLNRDAVIGKTSEEVIGAEATRGSSSRSHNRAFAGETLIYERPLIDANGRTRWIRGADRARPPTSTARSRASTSSATTSPT